MLARHVLTITAMVATPPLFAQETRPAALVRVLDCRALADPTERLACFDREVAMMEQAETAKELVVVDRKQIKEARRSLFGLPLPSLAIFGGRDDDVEEEDSRIESTIRTSAADPYGKYTFVLADGAVWRQTDGRLLNARPKPGQTIQIRRGAIGSYLANVNGQSAVRVTRDR